MGPSYGGRFFQSAINSVCKANISVDGKVGKGTIAAFSACQTKLGKVATCKAFIPAMDASQKDRYDYIVKRTPSQKVFYKGWLNHRIGNVKLSRCDSLV